MYEPLTSLRKLQKLRRQSFAWQGELPSALQVSFPVNPYDSIRVLNGGILVLGELFLREALSSFPRYPPGSSPPPSSFLPFHFAPLPLLSSAPPPSLYNVSPRVFTTRNFTFLGGAEREERDLQVDFVKAPSIIGGSLDMVRGHINFKEGALVIDYTINVELDLLVFVEIKEE